MTKHITDSSVARSIANLGITILKLVFQERSGLGTALMATAITCLTALMVDHLPDPVGEGTLEFRVGPNLTTVLVAYSAMALWAPLLEKACRAWGGCPRVPAAAPVDEPNATLLASSYILLIVACGFALAEWQERLMDHSPSQFSLAAVFVFFMTGLLRAHQDLIWIRRAFRTGGERS